MSFSFRPVVLGAVLVLLAAAPADSQLLGGLLGGGRSNPGDQQGEPAERDLNEGTIEDYLEMRAFAEGLYRLLESNGETKRSSEFKQRVDRAFEEASKQDMKRAYEMNVSAKSEVRYVIEDRFRVYSGLYDNPVVQALANRVGQSIVSPNVGRLYTFKLVADPIPWAESLSTGTVWVSTGMVALTKTKAQLAYVLAHEAAHVYLEHHRQRLMLQFAQEEYNKQLNENGERRRKVFTWIGTAAGALGGGLLGGALGLRSTDAAVLGALASGIVSNLIAKATTPSALESIEWNRFEEDEADRLALDWLLAAKIDVRQVPAVYVALRDIADRDARVKLGFLGRTDRVRERLAVVEARLKQEDTQSPLAGRQLESTNSEFDLLLAEVQRDNGVFAFHYDMLETSRSNLESAVSVKTKDPTALYFYARVLSQTAKTAEEREKAEAFFRLAAENDYRNHNYGSYLHRAIVMLSATDAPEVQKRQAVELLQKYVAGYHLAGADEARSRSQNLPPHLEMVYDYLARAGELRWTLDEATIERIRKAMESGVLLANYQGFGTTKAPSNVDIVTKPKPVGAKPTPTPVKRPN